MLLISFDPLKKTLENLWFSFVFIRDLNKTVARYGQVDSTDVNLHFHHEFGLFKSIQLLTTDKKKTKLTTYLSLHFKLWTANALCLKTGLEST